VAVGVALGAAGLGGLAGMRMVDVDEAKRVEERMAEAREMLSGKAAAQAAVVPVEEGSQGE